MTSSSSTEGRDNALTSAAWFLDRMADRLDQWATQSREGGWSTHQVEANRAAADDCRREASKLRNAALSKITGGQ